MSVILFLCLFLVADIDGNTFWSHPFNSLCHPKQLEEFIVMECSIVRDLKRSAGAGVLSKKVSSICPFLLLKVFGFRLLVIIKCGVQIKKYTVRLAVRARGITQQVKVKSRDPSRVPGIHSTKFSSGLQVLWHMPAPCLRHTDTQIRNTVLLKQS